MSQKIDVCKDCIKCIDGHCVGEEGYILSYRPWWAMLEGKCASKIVREIATKEDTK